MRRRTSGSSPARLTAQGEIVLTVIRNGVSHRFDSGGVRVFQPGDRIVVIRANAGQAERRTTARGPDARRNRTGAGWPTGPGYPRAPSRGHPREHREPARPPVRDLR